MQQGNESDKTCQKKRVREKSDSQLEYALERRGGERIKDAARSQRQTSPSSCFACGSVYAVARSQWRDLGDDESLQRFMNIISTLFHNLDTLIAKVFISPYSFTKSPHNPVLNLFQSSSIRAHSVMIQKYLKPTTSRHAHNVTPCNRPSINGRGSPRHSRHQNNRNRKHKHRF